MTKEGEGQWPYLALQPTPCGPDSASAICQKTSVVRTVPQTSSMALDRSSYFSRLSFPATSDGDGQDNL